MGPAYVSVDRGTDGKMWYTNTREWYSAIKRNEIMSFAATWMDLEIIISSELSGREKQILYGIPYMCS